MTQNHQVSMDSFSSIIIPFYNNWNLTHERMMDLYRFVPVDSCEIILVNDCSTDPEIDGGVAWWQKKLEYHKVRYVKNKTNLGFGGSMNKGAKIADGEVLVFLSNDVKIFSFFMSEVKQILSFNKALVGGELLDRNTGWNVIDGRVCPYLNGWFLASTKEAWEEVGGFDTEGFGKFDAEDIDISLRFLEKGYNLMQLTQSKLQHMGGQTVYKYFPDRQEYTKKNIEYLKQKWTGKLGFLDDMMKVY